MTAPLSAASAARVDDPDEQSGLSYIAGSLEGYFVYKREITVLRHPWKWSEPGREMSLGREIIARSAMLFDRRKPWKRHSLENIQWCMDAWIKIDLPEPEPLKFADGKFVPVRSTYAKAMYDWRSNESPLFDVSAWLRRYDSFYLFRKRWKRKGHWHAKHLLAQGGWDAAGV